ncbi:hypothetical protein KSS87_023209, partial [Heliosperma pusillum]
MGKAGVNNEANIPYSPLHLYYRKMARQMEHDFPQELVLEILKYLPVESLLRFMCVSKSWNSLITSPTFVATHLSCQSNPSSKDSISALFKVDSQFFMHRLYKPIDEWTEVDSPIENMGVIVGCCHGVVSLFNYFSKFPSPLVLWNPSIRKALTLPLKVPNFNKKQLRSVNSRFILYTFGFGFDVVSHEYKVVRICYYWVEESNTTYLHTDVCSLSKTGLTSDVTSIEGGKFILAYSGVYLNGAVHWICTRKPESTDIFKTILAFDLANGAFSDLHLPLSVAPHSIAVLMSVRKVEDKLAVSCIDSGTNVLENNYKDSGSNVWVMMEYGNPKSWRRLINVYLGDNVGMIKGALITGDGKTAVATSAGNWISWDCKNAKIENKVLPL